MDPVPCESLVGQYLANNNEWPFQRPLMQCVRDNYTPGDYKFEFHNSWGPYFSRTVPGRPVFVDALDHMLESDLFVGNNRSIARQPDGSLRFEVRNTSLFGYTRRTYIMHPKPAPI